MEIGETRIDAGVVKFALQYRQEIMDDQGLNIQVLSDIDGREVELLRFDCFDQNPHYHYGPEKENELLRLDKTTAGNPVGWTLEQLRTRLPDMIRRAGYEDIADRLDSYQQASRVATALDEVESKARETALTQRRTVTHNRGDEIIQAGNVKFGLEFRDLPQINDRGLAIHVLSDVAGQEIELLAFDCFERAPHYHYGPRNKDVRLYWDMTLVPDTLQWTLDQFKGGKLPAMVERAGYPGVVAELDRDLIISKIEKEVEPRALAIRAQNAK
jgi:hypothetical protein